MLRFLALLLSISSLAHAEEATCCNGGLNLATRQ